MKNEIYFNELLQKYVSGQCSPEEAEQVFARLKTPEGIRQAKAVLDEEAGNIFDPTLKIEPGISEEIYARLLSSMEADKNTGSRMKFSIYKRWRVAAVLAGFLILAGIGYKLVDSYRTVTYATDYAQKEVIVLPDHSTVTLNANSRLSYSRNWKNEQSREVFLEGEAFFNVVKNETKPFTVTTSEISIKVLGTSFNVKSYKEDKTIETTLVKGKVEIRDLDGPREKIVLKPNQKATYSKESADIVLDEVETALYTSWKSGLLIFEDKAFKEIAKELERWYGVKIDVKDDASKQCRFTIKIKDEPLTEVLDLFSSTTSARYSINGKKVTIEGKLCN